MNLLLRSKVGCYTKSCSPSSGVGGRGFCLRRRKSLNPEKMLDTKRGDESHLQKLSEGVHHPGDRLGRFVGLQLYLKIEDLRFKFNFIAYCFERC